MAQNLKNVYISFDEFEGAEKPELGFLTPFGFFSKFGSFVASSRGSSFGRMFFLALINVAQLPVVSFNEIKFRGKSYF